MMKKMRTNLKKYKSMIISALVVIILGLFGLVTFVYISNSNRVRTLNNDNYSIKYDKSWSVAIEKNDYVELNHKKSDSKIDIQIVPLKGEYRYKSIEELIDEIVDELKRQNDSYKFIANDQVKVTKSEFNGYRLLYESEDDETLVTVYKKSDKLVVITYQASYEDFDILLDSVQNIIYNLDIKETKVDLSYKIEIDTSDISYTSDPKLESMLKGSSQGKIANSNYEVTYSLPDIFNEKFVNSQIGRYQYKKNDNSYIDVTMEVQNVNLYEYASKDSNNGVYSKYKYTRDSSESHEYAEGMSYLDSQDESYIYKNSYSITRHDYMKDEDYDSNRENIELIYVLDKSHIFTISISSVECVVPKKLIDMFRIESIVNYSSYVKVETEEDSLIGFLKRKVDENEESLKIKLPIKYSEYDMNMNIYEYRYYRTDYDSEKEMYDYSISYHLTSEILDDIESHVKSINNTFYDTYGRCDLLNGAREETYNGRNFIVYDGGYDYVYRKSYNDREKYNYYVNKKALFFKLDKGGYLIIEISGNGKEITRDIIEKVTSFEIY